VLVLLPLLGRGWGQREGRGVEHEMQAAQLDDDGGVEPVFGRS